MNLRVIPTILFLLYLFSYNGLEGKELSGEEDLKLKKQFKLLNKPAVQTIKTINGDVYNCVDFYQQPAFDHPLLKNHSFDYKIKPPSYTKKRRYESEDDSALFDPSKIWLNGNGCPVGTIPIKKITKNDIFRAKLASEMYASNVDPQSVETPGLHFGIMRPQAGPRKKYYGAAMHTTLHRVKVQKSQSSYSRMKIKRDGDYIEVGWMVNPVMYKDNETRMYIYTNAGASRCFNLFCPGFVQTSRIITVDHVFYFVPGQQSYARYMIDYDKKNGNWYLHLDRKGTVLGYWDSRLFKTGLGKFASYIDWGGQVYGPTSLSSAPMGAGVAVSGDQNKDAYFWQIQYADENGYKIADNIEGYADVGTYSVWDGGIRGDDYERVFFYGGPGGYIGN